MSVSLSIKDVPEALAARLRQRAARNHRSLQRELMAIVEAATRSEAHMPVPVPAPEAALLSTALPAQLLAMESLPSYNVKQQPQQAAAPDSLLDELDAIVASSVWGQAPLLPRDLLHDRALAREFDFEARQTEARLADGSNKSAA